MFYSRIELKKNKEIVGREKSWPTEAKKDVDLKMRGSSKQIGYRAAINILIVF